MADRGRPTRAGWAVVLLLVVALVAAPVSTGRGLADAPRVLVLTRTEGFRHASIPQARRALVTIGAQAGLRVTLTSDVRRFTPEGLRPFRAVVFALTTGDVLDPPAQTALRRFVERGGGFAGIHSAADTESGWPFYGRLLGARFRAHPPVQAAVVEVIDRSHPSTAHLPRRWERTDEWYAFAEGPDRAVHVLARLDERSYSPGEASMGGGHPIAWCQRVGRGRSWYTAGGHTVAAYAEPDFREHLAGGLRYATGQAAAGCS